jgi:dephospho-CoA kinase
MIIYIIVGMPAAGKNIACEYAATNKYPYFSTGDIVRAEVKRRGIEPNAENTAVISTQMRGDDGLGVSRTVISEAIKRNAPVVFLEGLRSWPEIEFIKSKANCIVIAIVAPRALRLTRIEQRGRADDSARHFDERDSREINYGVATCIALADEYIINSGTLKDAYLQLDKIIKSALGSKLK